MTIGLAGGSDYGEWRKCEAVRLDAGGEVAVGLWSGGEKYGSPKGAGKRGGLDVGDRNSTCKVQITTIGQYMRM